MKVVVDRSKCVSLGVCETISEVFELDEDSELVIHEDRVPGSGLDELREAVQSCPVKALTLSTSDDAVKEMA
jgi:ferredoxin